MGSTALCLAEIQQLKKEETLLCDMINAFKSQLNKLKVEELSLTSKVRHQKGIAVSSQRLHNRSEEDSEDVNAIELDLTLKNDLLNKLARGGGELLEHSDEEEEEEDDDLMEEVGGGQDDLRNFLEDLKFEN